MRFWRIVVGLLTLWPSVSPGAATAQVPSRTLVLPFDTGRDQRAWWLGEGTSVALADALRAIGVDVIARDERLDAFTKLQVPPVAGLSHGTVIRVGQLVGAQAVVFGSIALDGDTLAIRARSLRLDTGRLGAEMEERGQLRDLFAIVDRVAGRVAPLNVTPRAGEARPPSPSPEAFEQYMKGLLAETVSAQVPLLEKALALDPAFDRARLALWRVYTDNGRPDKALTVALAVKPTSGRHQAAQFDAALSELALERYDDAFERLRHLWEETSLPTVANNLGVAQVRRGASPTSGKATYWFTQATERDPGDADYFFNLGYAYWVEQDPKAAVYWLREAVRRDPADADSHFVLGAALKLSGGTAEGEREFELARRLSERYETGERKVTVPPGLERLKGTLDTVGPRRADLVLVQAEQRDQRQLATFHLERGRRFFETESDREAMAELQRALYLSPYLAEAHLLRGRILLRGGRPSEAIDALKIALWSEESAAGHLALAEAYRKAHQPEQARAEAARALALDPQSSDAREILDEVTPP